MSDKEIKIEKRVLKLVKTYCEDNNILDINKFINDKLSEIINVLKYGDLNEKIKIDEKSLSVKKFNIKEDILKIETNFGLIDFNLNDIIKKEKTEETIFNEKSEAILNKDSDIEEEVIKTTKKRRRII